MTGKKVDIITWHFLIVAVEEQVMTYVIICFPVQSKQLQAHSMTMSKISLLILFSTLWQTVTAHGGLANYTVDGTWYRGYKFPNIIDHFARCIF